MGKIGRKRERRDTLKKTQEDKELKEIEEETVRAENAIQKNKADLAAKALIEKNEQRVKQTVQKKVRPSVTASHSQNDEDDEEPVLMDEHADSSDDEENFEVLQKKILSKKNKVTLPSAIS